MALPRTNLVSRSPIHSPFGQVGVNGPLNRVAALKPPPPRPPRPSRAAMEQLFALLAMESLRHASEEVPHHDEPVASTALRPSLAPLPGWPSSERNMPVRTIVLPPPAPYYSPTVSRNSASSWETRETAASSIQGSVPPPRPPPPVPKRETSKPSETTYAATRVVDGAGSQNLQPALPGNSIEQKQTNEKRSLFTKFTDFGDGMMKKLDEVIGYSGPEHGNRVPSGNSPPPRHRSTNFGTRNGVDAQPSPRSLRRTGNNGGSFSTESTPKSPRIPLETRPKPGDWSMDDSWEHPPARKQPESFPQESPAVCLKCRDFSTPDHHASRFPRQSYNNIRQLAIELTSPFSDPIDKARAIFTWMHENIAYDVENFFNGTVKASTPEATLRSGLAVCAGYADLFAAMASHANLKAVVVQGHGKGYGYCRVTDGRIPKFKAGHAWNAVKFPHGWHLIDCCWGAGSVSEQKFNKRFAPSFFTQSPEEFRCRHFPSKASNQHCRDTISWETYILMDDGPTIYRDFTDARVDFSPYTLEPATLVLAPKTRYQFRVTRSCEHQGQTPLVVLLCVDGKEKLPLRNDGRGGLTCTGTTGSTGTTLSLMYITNLDGKPSGSFTVDYYESRVGRAAYSFSGLCQWTVG